VQKVYASMRRRAPALPAGAVSPAIPVVGRPSRRSVGVSRYPVYAASQSAPSRVMSEALTQAPAAARAPAPTPPQQALEASLPQVAGNQLDAPVILTAAGPLDMPAGRPASLSVPESETAGTDEAFVF
jgi:type IV secretion system protein VirB1